MDRPPLPRITPMAPTLIAQPFHRAGWVYEEKYDGWRVVAYKNATGLGAVGKSAAASGAPGGTVTTTQDHSWVWGVGFDWTAAIHRTVGTGQTLFQQTTDKANNTDWVQSATAATPAGGTAVTINDTAPTSDRYDLVVIEIL